MENSQNLDLPLIMTAQAQKHITHNEAILALDTLVQLCVLDRDLSTPPVTPDEGSRFIVGAVASAQWEGKEMQVAVWQSGVWVFYPAKLGWICWISDEDILVVWDGASWSEVNKDVTNPALFVGVNAIADVANRLSVSSSNSLFSHEGTDHRVKINKAASGNTASILFQDNWSGRAEFGLTGDDDFNVKVSSDGVVWKNAMAIDKGTGVIKVTEGTVFGSGSDVFNEYEEGEFTPFFAETTPASTFTHDKQEGNYIRVGNLVTCWGYVSTSAVSIVGNEKIRINGLPFSSRNNSGNHYAGLIAFSKGFSTTSNPTSIMVLENTSNTELEIRASSDARSELDITLRASHLSTGDNSVRFSMSYLI